MQTFKNTLTSLFLFLLASLWFFPAMLHALDFDALLADSLKGNTEYQRALLSHRQAQAAVPDLFTLKDSSLSVSPQISSAETGESELTLDTTLTLSVLEQINFWASLNQALETGVGVKLLPLAHSSTRDLALIALDQARVTVEKTDFSTRTSTAKGAIALVNARRNLDRAIQDRKIKFSIYEDAKTQNKADASLKTADDLRDAFKDLMDARTAELAAQDTFGNGEVAMASLLGSAWPLWKGKILSLDAASLDTAVQAVKAEFPQELQLALSREDGVDPAGGFDGFKAAKPEGSSLRLAKLALAKGRTELDHTWLMEPTLSLSGGLNFDQNGKLSWQAGVVIGLSPGDFKVQERKNLEEEIRILQDELESARRTETLEYTQALGAVSSAIQARKAAQADLAAAGELFQETSVLKGYGQASDIELAQAQLSLDQAQDQVCAAAGAEFLAWHALKKWY